LVVVFTPTMIRVGYTKDNRPSRPDRSNLGLNPEACRSVWVKSLVLDRRKEIGALPLEFKAERDEQGQPTLSEGQRVMLRAGLAKLRKLEADFAKIDPTRHPKMLVVCEDTTVSPLVAAFLQEQEGLHDNEVIKINSTNHTL
jgi:type III restriction enzyme